MIVCVCRRISDRDIARHARAGMGFDEIQWELGVATQCGRCEDCVRDVVAQCCATAPVAALRNETIPACACKGGAASEHACHCGSAAIAAISSAAQAAPHCAV